MRTLLHSLTFGLTTLLGLDAVAQFTNVLLVNGTVGSCYPGQFVTLTTTGGTSPAYTIDIPLSPNTCTFSVALDFGSPYASYSLTTLCGGMTLNVYDSTWFASGDTTLSLVSVNCGTSTPDCEGVLGGTAVPGSSCTAPSGAAGTWSANCDCVPDPPACQACFIIEPVGNGGVPTPFAANFINCTSGGTPPFTFEWSLPDGSASTSTNESWVFPDEGVYGVCLTITDVNSCTSYVCDSVYVNADGNISTNGYLDCSGVVGGPDIIGTPCVIPETNLPGVWSYFCECVEEVFPPCYANYAVIQAFDNDSLPIASEVWVWNLTTGGVAPFQYLWSFGDGTSSTDAFPTHTYASGNSYELCLTINDNAGCTHTYCETISVDGDGILNGLTAGTGNRNTFTIRVMDQLSTAVAERPVFTEMTTWPNPVNNELNVSLTSAMKGNVRMSITDLSGRIVMNENRALTNGLNRMSVPVAELGAGLYVMQLTNGNNTVGSRFVKVR